MPEDPAAISQTTPPEVPLEAAARYLKLKNPNTKGGDVFAQGTARVPGKSVAVAVLPVTTNWHVWKTCEIEVVTTG
jgi:hypothetical protein